MIDDMLYQTKLFVPPSDDNWVARPHLIAKLNDALPCKMVLVSAPAGYGKTTFVTGWINQIQQNKNIACWVSLDKEDSDPNQFFRYLAAAIEPLPSVQTSLSQSLQSNQAIPAKNLIQRFIGDVTTVSSDFFLVLDDYHRLDSDEIDIALSSLLDYMPSQMTLVLTSRIDPGFPISRLRARRDIVEIRAEDLRFTAEEAAEFFEQTMGLILDSSHLNALEEKTEGWISGLQMAALSLQNRSATGSAEFVSQFSGSHRYVLDFLAEEVLMGQPNEIREFLLRTSILDRLSGPLCDAITGRGNGQQVLETLERSNLFVIPLDHERHWYRYHHLFADFLRNRLVEQMSPDDRQNLYQQASTWCDAQQFGPEAINYALKSADTQLVLMAAENYLLKKLLRDELSQILYWTKTVSDSGVPLSPAMQIMESWALLFSSQMHSLTAKLDALESLPDPASGSPNIKGNLLAMHSWLAMFQSDFERSLELTSQALDLLSTTGVDLWTRSNSLLNLGNAKFGLGDLDGAVESFTAALEAAQRSGTIITEMFARTYLADALVDRGQLRDAEERYRQAIEVAKIKDKPYSSTIGVSYLGLGRLLLTWHRVDEAAKLIEQALELFKLTQIDTMLFLTLRAKASVKLASGNLDEALKVLAESEKEFLKMGSSKPRARFVYLRAQINRLMGNESANHQWAAEQLPLDATAEQNPVWRLDQYYHNLCLANVWATQDPSQAKRALHLLTQTRAMAEQKGYFNFALQAKISQAVAWQTIGDEDRALNFLAEALADGEPEGHIYIFVKEGGLLQRLLRLALRRKLYPDFVRRLLAAFPAESSVAPTHQPLVDPLSERELEVLALLAEGDSNAEIAEKLVITVGTTKRHVSNILGKLSVSSRTQAVASGREMGLI